MNIAQEENRDINSSTLYNHIDSLDIDTSREFSLCDSIESVAGEKAVVSYTQNRDIHPINNNLKIDSISNFASIALIFVIYTIIFTFHRKYNSALLRAFSYNDRLERIINMLEVNSTKYMNWGQFLYYITTSHLISVLLSERLADMSVPSWIIFTIALLTLVVSESYINLFDKTIGYLTNNGAFRSSQNIFRKSFHTIISITVSPLCLAVVSAPFLSTNTAIYMTISLTILTVLMYCRMLYVNLSLQNFSFLEYILYLCSAEIMPTLTIIVIIFRYFT